MADGPTNQIADKYEESHHSKKSELTESLPRRWGSGEIKLLDVRVLDLDKNEQLQLVHGEPVYIELYYLAGQPVERPEFSLMFYRQGESLEEQPDSVIQYVHGGILEGQGVATCRIDSLTLLPAVYRVAAMVNDSLGEVTYDHFDGLRSFQVVPDPDESGSGFVHIPASWETSSQSGNEAIIAKNDASSTTISSPKDPPPGSQA